MRTGLRMLSSTVLYFPDLVLDRNDFTWRLKRKACLLINDIFAQNQRMKHLLLPLIFFCSLTATAQKGREKIDGASKELMDDLSAFSKNLVGMPLFKNVEELASKADNPYKQYIIGCTLYEIDQNKSYDLISAAWESDKSNPWFSLEYAIALHRMESYEKAIPLYLVYAKAFPEDTRVSVWLSECYLHTENYPAAVQAWRKGGKHTAADFAICTIHKEHDLLDMRREMLDNINQQMPAYIYELIYTDFHWESDWWNEQPQLNFLQHDLQFIHERYGDTSVHYQTVKTYASIKQLASDGAQQDKIKAAFTESKLIIEGHPFPENGFICADLIEIALLYNIETAENLLMRRAELEKLMVAKRDVEFLNISANLEARVNGFVSKELDLFGWKKAGDIRFASSYFIGIKDLKSDNEELQQALMDFPNSSFLRVLKINLLEKEGKPIPQEAITEAIRLEYNGLWASSSRYCDALNYLYQLLGDSPGGK
jgi:hypothetical protein